MQFVLSFGLLVCVANVASAVTASLSYIDAASWSVGGEAYLTISSDGKHLYAGNETGSLTVFERSSGSGLLSQIQSVSGISGFNPKPVAIAPDDRFVYTLSKGLESGGGGVPGTGQLDVFARDLFTGLLTHQTSATGGNTETPFRQALEMTTDGSFLYAAGNRFIEAYSRNGVTGNVALANDFDDADPGLENLTFLDGLGFDPDQTRLYSASRDDNAIHVFNRNAITGALSLVQMLQGKPENPTGLDIDGPTHITVSPDGKHAYVASQFSDSLSVFSVDSVTGVLTHLKTYLNGEGGMLLDHAEDILIAPDGQTVFVTSVFGGLDILERDLVTGFLTLSQSFQDGVGGVDGLFRPREMILSPDLKHLYVTAAEEGKIGIFGVSGLAQPPTSGAGIPEPTVVVLLALGVGFLGRRRSTL